MGMEIDAFYWTFVALVYLNDVLGPKVIEFNLFVMGARSNAVTKGMKFDLMNNTVVFLVGLYGFLSS